MRAGISESRVCLSGVTDDAIDPLLNCSSAPSSEFDVYLLLKTELYFSMKYIKKKSVYFGSVVVTGSCQTSLRLAKK